MPRIRTIKPEFFDSPGTAAASVHARLFFIAMWCWADDYGVGTANPRQLMSFAFPNDPDMTAKDFPTLRKEVADSFGVVFYEVDGRPYYMIPSWDKHQRTERKAKRQHPAPVPSVSAGQGHIEGTTVDAQGSSDATQGSSGVGTGEQGNRGSKRVSSNAGRLTVLDSFTDFWDAYPRKTGKEAAKKAYASALKKTSPDRILDGAVRYRDDPARVAQYTKHPTTWLNGGCWDDEPFPVNHREDPSPWDVGIHA